MTEDYNNLPRSPFALRRRLRQLQEADAKRAADEVQKEDEPKLKSLHGSWSEEVEPNKPRWTYLITPVGALIGSFVVFFGILLTYVQNDDKNRAERLLNAKRLTHENAENTVRRLETQFSEVQNRLSNSDPRTRAVAVSQLADLALTPLPADALDDVSETVKASDFSRKHYPFFLRSIRQYATTLPMEENTNVRATMKVSVERLVRFACLYAPVDRGGRVGKISLPAPEYPNVSFKVEGGNNPQMGVYEMSETDVVLRESVAQFATANVRTKDAFVSALADYFEENPVNDEQLDLVSTVIEFRNVYQHGREIDKSILMNLMVSNVYNKRRITYRAKHKSQNEDSGLLDEVDDQANRLKDARDVLAAVLRSLPPPNKTNSAFLPALREELSNMKEEAENAISSMHNGKTTVTMRTPEQAYATLRMVQEVLSDNPHDLNGVFLCGSDLVSAELQGADMIGVCLHGANLRRANLANADLAYTSLQGADLSNANLQNADLGGAELEGADFKNTNLKGVCFYNVTYTPKKTKAYDRTNFKEANWKEASFTLPKESIYLQKSVKDKETLQFQSWLKMTFPYDDDPAVTRSIRR